MEEEEGEEDIDLEKESEEDEALKIPPKKRTPKKAVPGKKNGLLETILVNLLCFPSHPKTSIIFKFTEDLK